MIKTCVIGLSKVGTIHSKSLIKVKNFVKLLFP